MTDFLKGWNKIGNHVQEIARDALGQSPVIPLSDIVQLKSREE